MTLRWLDGGEAVDLLNPIIEAQGWTPLNDRTCRVLVAFDDGEPEAVLGFLVLQLFPLLGPEYVDPAARDAGVMFQLHAEMQKFLVKAQARGVMVIAESEVSKRLCERARMTPIEAPVYIATEFGGSLDQEVN
jgi:hypothetical protein